ncbi:3570_t:CDS:2, partial [Diversispora eburnea]
KAISFWISQVSTSGLTINNNILCEKVRDFVQALNISKKSLSLSHGWLMELLFNYELENIYNTDETGLFYKMTSNQTLVTGPV